MAAGASYAETTPASSASEAAAAADSTQVTQVVVTASRRGEQNVQNTPMAIDAYSGRTLQRLNVQSLQDLSKIDPSLSIQSFGANQQQVIIRGISSTTGQTAGIYVDEAPLEGGFNANLLGDNTPGLELHDIDHVEVLKGPQGTLFGAGSMSGTVRVITNQPKLDVYEGSVEASAASIDGGNALFDGNAALNIPLVKDQLAARLAVWGDNGGGFIDQTIGSTTRSNVNDQHVYGGRFSFLWQPTDRFSLTGSVNYQHVKVDGAQSWTQYIGPLYDSGPNAGKELGPYPAYQNHSPTREPYRSDYTLGTLTGRYDLGFGKIIASGSYGHKDELELIDTSPSDCANSLCYGAFGFPGVFSAHSQFTNYTAEVRFSSDFKGPFQLVSGVYYEHDALIYDGAVINSNLATGVAPCDTYAACKAAGLLVAGHPFDPASPVEFANEDRFNVNQYAFYAQGDYKILSNLTATVGIRYFMADLRDEQINQQDISPTFDNNGNCVGGYVCGVVTTPYVSSRSSTHESQPTYNFSLLWKATDNISLYVRAASGFRIGGINEAATIASQEGIPVPSAYQPDSLWDYEGGIKFYAMERKLYVDLAVYHIDWSGEQEDALAAGVYNYTLNVGKSEINGLELSSTFHPIAGLTLQGSVTYVDAYLATDLPASVVDAGTLGRAGDRSPFVPRYTASAVAEYEHTLAGDVLGYGQVSVSYRSSEYSALEASAAGQATNYYTKLPAYTLVDLKAGVRFDNYDVSLFANNVANTVAEVGAKAALDGIRIFPARPRTVGVRVAAHF
ncbi:MAG: TonB-dependent receptor [Caulobacteraceae bacterium]|nr:TonB-dependent receptor [Caulobacteraceae bacterium]